MKRWRLAAVLVGLALVAILLMALTRPRGVPVQVVEVRRGDLVVPVQCDGTLEPPPGGELRAAEVATVAEIPAHEGARVVAGTTLVRLDNAELSQKALDARSEALRLRADRASAEADLAEAERAEKHQREVVEADARLLSSGAISRATAETDERALRQAEDRTRSTRARLAGLDGAGIPAGARRADRLGARAPRRRPHPQGSRRRRRLRPPAPGRRDRHRRPGRGERRGSGEAERAGARGSAGPSARRDRAAPRPPLRRPSAREVGRHGHVRVSGPAPRSPGAKSARFSGTSRILRESFPPTRRWRSRS